MSKPRRGSPLWTYLIVPMSLFVVIAASVAGYQRRTAFDDARRSALADARFGAQIAAKQLDDAVTQALGDVAGATQSPAFAGVVDAPAGCTLTSSSGPPFPKGHLDIVATDGGVLCSSLAPDGSTPYAHAAWLAEALKGSVVRAPIDDPRTGKRSVVVAAPVGTVAVLAEVAELDAVAPSLGQSLGGPRHLRFTVNFTGAPSALHVDRSQYTGRATVAAYKWTVVASTPRSAALANAERLSNRLMVSVALALVFALVLLWALHRRIARPLRAVGAAVRSATDDLTLPEVEFTGPSELSALLVDVEHFVEAARRERDATTRVVALEQQIRHAERVHEHERELRLLDDRERIGRDLHDTVIQRLFATGLALEGLSSRVEDVEIRRRLAAAVDELDETIHEVRSAIFAIERGEVAAPRDAFAELTQDAAITLGFEATVTFAGPVDTDIPSHIADQMLATLRESLSNVARHAAAHRAEVTVSVEDEIILRVSDDGVGLDADAASSAGGLGLRSMRARAARLGGELRLESPATGGTILEWRVPRVAAH